MIQNNDKRLLLYLEIISISLSCAISTHLNEMFKHILLRENIQDIFNLITQCIYDYKKNQRLGVNDLFLEKILLFIESVALPIYL